MNCKNCAAPLTKAVGLSQMVCTFCHTVQVATDVSGIVDRVLSLGELLGVHCPACDAELVTALVDEVPAALCSGCQGVLFSSTEFRQVVEDRRAAYTGPEMGVTLLHPAEFERRLECPGCHAKMEVHPYYGAGRAIIDSCGMCKLVWVDHGELTNLERSPGRRSPAMMEIVPRVGSTRVAADREDSDDDRPADTEPAKSPGSGGLFELVSMLLG
ncbi:MAG: zf-TFIIB domain-containing protein [Planctomycetaceae bacterium]